MLGLDLVETVELGLELAVLERVSRVGLQLAEEAIVVEAYVVRVGDLELAHLAIRRVQAQYGQALSELFACRVTAVQPVVVVLSFDCVFSLRFIITQTKVSYLS